MSSIEALILGKTPLRVLVLYRPKLPSTRAQSIQVLGTAHALAELGCQVTVIADLPDTGPRPERRDILNFYQLSDTPNLDLRLPKAEHKTLSGLWFRWQVLRWLYNSVVHQPERSVILARSKGYADEVMSIPFGPPLVLEAHEVDSALARERGESASAFSRVEARLLKAAEGIVTNTAGTLEGLEVGHPGLMAANRKVVYNATNPHRVREHRPGARHVVGYAGSLKRYKGLPTLLEAAKLLGPGVEVELMGGSQQELDTLGPLPPNVRWAGPVPYHQVPDVLQRWHAALLPLDADLFGEKLCNPLKLWDYRAIGLPLIAADVGSLREVIEPQQAQWYAPGDPVALAQAIHNSLGPPTRARKRQLRSWRARAMELLPVLEAAVAP
jgi:glycosyltransferase involved in cell wall biosynthesis